MASVHSDSGNGGGGVPFHECVCCRNVFHATELEQQPRNLDCGHSFCTACLRKTAQKTPQIYPPLLKWTCAICTRISQRAYIDDLPLNRSLLQFLEEHVLVTPWFDECAVIPPFVRANVPLESFTLVELAVLLADCRDRLQAVHLFRRVIAKVASDAHSDTRPHVQTVTSAVLGFALRQCPYPYDPELTPLVVDTLLVLATVPEFRASLAQAGAVEFITKGIQKEILFETARKPGMVAPPNHALLRHYSLLVATLSIDDTAAGIMAKNDCLRVWTEFVAVCGRGDNVVARNVFYGLESLIHNDAALMRHRANTGSDLIELTCKVIDAQISLIQDQRDIRPELKWDCYSKLGADPEQASDASSLDQYVITDRPVDVLTAAVRFLATLSRSSQHDAIHVTLNEGIARIQRLLIWFGNHAKIVYHSVCILTNVLVHYHPDVVTTLVVNQLLQLHTVPRLVELLRYYLLRRDETNCTVLCYVLGRITGHRRLAASILCGQVILLYRDVLDAFPRHPGVAQAVISALTRASVYLELRPIIETCNIVLQLQNIVAQLNMVVQMEPLRRSMQGPMQSALQVQQEP